MSKYLKPKQHDETCGKNLPSSWWNLLKQFGLVALPTTLQKEPHRLGLLAIYRFVQRREAPAAVGGGAQARRLRPASSIRRSISIRPNSAAKWNGSDLYSQVEIVGSSLFTSGRARMASKSAWLPSDTALRSSPFHDMVYQRDEFAELP